MTYSTGAFFILGVFNYVYFGSFVGDSDFYDFFLPLFLSFTAVLSFFYIYLETTVPPPFIFYLSFQRSMTFLWGWSSGILEKLLAICILFNFSFSFHIAITFLWELYSPATTNPEVVLTGYTKALAYYFSYLIVKIPFLGIGAALNV